MNPLIQMLMNKLQTQNQQGFQMANAVMQNNGDPKALLKQVMSGIQPEQKQIILHQAKQYGCPDSILSQIQNMK